VKKIKKSKIKLIKKSFTGELYDSSLILSKIPIICKEWITKEKLCNFNSMLEVLEKQLTLEQLRLVYRNIATVEVKKLTPIDSLSVCGYYKVDGTHHSKDIPRFYAGYSSASNNERTSRVNIPQ